VVDRLGVSYEQVGTVRSDIIYCSISGHGQTGPLRDRPGHDGTYLAISGASPIRATGSNRPDGLASRSLIPAARSSR
jgi:alpha-methylacyl-CoA racemase